MRQERKEDMFVCRLFRDVVQYLRIKFVRLLYAKFQRSGRISIA